MGSEHRSSSLADARQRRGDGEMVPTSFERRRYAVVTGGAGFLGSHVVDRLVAENYEVAVLDVLHTGTLRNLTAHIGNPHVHILTHDVRQSLLALALPCAASASKDSAADGADRQAGATVPGPGTTTHHATGSHPTPQTRSKTAPRVDCIYHFACPAAPDHYQADPIFTTMTCVQGTFHALELATHHGCPILIASTSEVYGDPAEHPQREAYWGHVNCTGVRACYDEGKRCAESLVFDFHRRYGTKVRVARLFNTYGPRMAINDGRVVSNFVVNALRGDPLTIYGDGTQTRSLQYVDDLVEAIMRFSAHPTEIGPLNIGCQDERSVQLIAQDVLSAVEEVCGSRSASQVTYGPAAADDPHQRLPDTERARACLDGWQPRVPLTVGLKRTVKDFQARLLEEVQTRDGGQTVA